MSAAEDDDGTRPRSSWWNSDHNVLCPRTSHERRCGSSALAVPAAAAAAAAASASPPRPHENDLQRRRSGSDAPAPATDERRRAAERPGEQGPYGRRGLAPRSGGRGGGRLEPREALTQARGAESGERLVRVQVAARRRGAPGRHHRRVQLQRRHRHRRRFTLSTPPHPPTPHHHPGVTMPLAPLRHLHSCCCCCYGKEAVVAGTRERGAGVLEEGARIAASVKKGRREESES